MALQLALTTLESLAEMLNERKREAEQFAAFRDKIRNISGSKFGKDGCSRFLLKEDDVTQLVSEVTDTVQRLLRAQGELGLFYLAHPVFASTEQHA